MTEFLDLETQDGVRMPWNVIPGTKHDSSNAIIPVSALYTPLKPLPSTTPTLPYAPLRCRNCRSVLNPFSIVDFASKIWICPFCLARNHFPPHYHSISDDNLPAELYPQCTTIEYESSPAERSPVPPVFLFVVDTCVIEEEDQIMEQMGFFVKRARPATGVVAGVKDGLSQESISRFLLPASECEFAMNSILEELQKDPWPVPTDQRATRCTGTALSVAAHLLGACVPGSGARIMAFTGGPTTEGPGAIIGKNLSEPVRSHKDLDKDSAPYYHKAVKFYEGLAKQLVHQGHVLDLFACALDQVGVAELKVAVERTGGLVVLAESFGHSVFKDSFKRVFRSGDYDLGLSSNGIFEVNCSKDIRVQGIIGPCASLEKKGPLSSETVIGQGNTTAWKMCGLDKATSLCLVFEMVKKDSPEAIDQSANNQFYFQFLTYYQHSSGQMRLRTTTLSRRWVAGPGSIQARNFVNFYFCSDVIVSDKDSRNIPQYSVLIEPCASSLRKLDTDQKDLISGFDQEAAAAVMARLVSFKMETEAEFDPIRWLDKSLIHLCSRFGEYQKESPSSFSLSPRFSIFPQFIFHLRRSQFVQVFNNSPDETAYFRMILYRENVANSVVMIQPSLISYSFHSTPEPALLDVAAISADRILLLDSYFTIVVFHGSTIAQWRKAGYHNQPEHVLFLGHWLLSCSHPFQECLLMEAPQSLQVFAQLLQAPHDDANAILKERFPAPRLVICDQHGSQARFLLAKLNPSATYNSDMPASEREILFTDDVSFETFLDHLQRLAVQ
ncbi:hypothetical protein RHGRI_019432 [Rhododendron griersonianum]|uniref:Protein transport protein SEC23 n=1 Tax=Rhododendron griersonianum TaxID=479676 RepID=A0AAV6JFG7_9ERIC|nr:hypothetical protein RHGRI_019432 [Rhododendron griersonianum]